MDKCISYKQDDVEYEDLLEVFKDTKGHDTEIEYGKYDTKNIEVDLWENT